MKIEQIDDLRQAWQTMGEGAPGLTAQLQSLETAWNQRRNKMLRRFLIECGLCFLVYAVAIAFIIFGTTETPRRLFGLKIVMMSLVFFIPFTVSFYHAIRQLSEKNATESMGGFIHRSVARLKRLKRIYLIGNYVFCLMLLLAFWFDPFLSVQPAWIRWGCYLLDITLLGLAVPMWNISYGRDLRHFEKIEKEWFEGDE